MNRTMPALAVLTGLLPAAVGLVLGGCGRDVVPPPKIEIPALVPPLQDAAVGEQLIMRRGAQEWHYTVVSAGDLEVVCEVITYVNGAPQGKPQRFSWHRNNFGLPDNAVIRKLEPGRVEIEGERFDCWLMHVSTRGRGQYYYWLSDEVGVHGILKIARSDGGAPDETNAITWVSDSLSGRSLR